MKPWRLYMAVDTPESDWKNFIVVVREPKRRRFHLNYNAKEQRFSSNQCLKDLEARPDAEAIKTRIIEVS